MTTLEVFALFFLALVTGSHYRCLRELNWKDYQVEELSKEILNQQQIIRELEQDLQRANFIIKSMDNEEPEDTDNI